MNFRLLLPFLFLVPGLWAGLRTIHVTDRSDLAGGKPYAQAGPYERIVAKAYFAVDPRAAANAGITDIQHAPRNAQGQVEFSADLYVLKPRDSSKGNGTVFFEVSNRGGKGLLRMFNFGQGELDTGASGALGDNLLLDAGYTLVWLGWQFDVPQGNLLRATVPVAQGITGLVRSDFNTATKVTRFPVAARDHVPYPAADLRDPNARLTVRDTSFGERRLIPRDRWRFADATTVEMDAGFEPGKTYEVVYTAKDPALAGLGSAGVRDLISFLKYGGGDAVALLGDQRRFVKRAIAFGQSQSGRYLRQFLLDGFNADEKGRIVFDAVWPHIAGAAVGSFHHRFAQPSRSSPYYTTDIFPFRDLSDEDPATGWTGGILDRSTKAGVVPKIFYTNSSNEYWGRSASLTHTSIDGAKNVPLPSTTRIYHLTGTQHGPGMLPPARSGGSKYEINTNDYRPVLRALLRALEDWLASGKEPPASRYSSPDQLAPLDQLRFPKIPGFLAPQYVRQAMRLDYGAEFRGLGIIANEPPKVIAGTYAVKLPQVDADGNELGGIRMPSVQVPLATYAGWNLANSTTGAAGEMLGLQGSHIAFARTKAERTKSGDERLSVEERYKDRADYQARVESASRALVNAGYLLERDATEVNARCLRQWDMLADHLAPAAGSLRRGSSTK